MCTVNHFAFIYCNDSSDSVILVLICGTKTTISNSLKWEICHKLKLEAQGKKVLLFDC